MRFAQLFFSFDYSKSLNLLKQGLPFNTDDAMFNPPVSRRQSQYDMPNDLTLVSTESQPIPVILDDYALEHQPHFHLQTAPRKRKSLTRNRIIPLEEDMRRLFQECKIGEGNASLLSEALAFAKPEDLKKKDIIRVSPHIYCLSLT